MLFEGYLSGNGRVFPVYSQKKITPIGDVSSAEWEQIYLPIINEQMRKIGYSGEGTYYGKFTVGDIYPQNIGFDEYGNIKFFDADVYKKGGKLK